MENDQPENSPEKKPSREDTAEQEARYKEYKEKTEHLLERHQRDEILTPKLFLGIISAYMLFIAAFGAVGVLAFYSEHKTTLEIIFVITLVLLLAVPVVIIWYLRIRFNKKPEEKTEHVGEGILNKLKDTPFGKFLLWFSSNPIAQFLQYSFFIYLIADAIIRQYPIHPRLSIASVAYNLAVLLMSLGLRLIIWYVRPFESEIRYLLEYAAFLRESDRKLLDILEKTNNFLKETCHVVESSSESVDAIRESQILLFKNIAAILMPNSPSPDMENALPGESQNETAIEDTAKSNTLDIEPPPSKSEPG